MSSMNNQLVGEGNSGGGTAGLASTSQHRANNPDSNSLPRVPQSSNSIASSIQNQNQVQNQVPLPQHFVVRPGVTKHTASGTVTTPGPIVPLVAVDQLPTWLDLSGVPRELSLEQTIGLTNLGTVVRKPEFYTVHMRSDLEITPSVSSSDSIAEGTPQLREFRSKQVDQVQRHHRITTVESKNDGRLISVDTPAATASPSMPSSAAPVTEELASTLHGSRGNKIGANGSSITQAINNNNAEPKTRRHKIGNSPQPQTPSMAGMTIGMHPRIPSPTAAGSTPPANSNPYPILHHYPPHLHPPHHPYPMAPPPSPLHPADRMLQSWYNPLHPYSHPKPPSSAATSRQKSDPGGSNNSSSVGGGNGNGSSTPGNNNDASIYCRHWCHRGTCRWGMQCRYAHAMPATPEGLREVGLTHHPAWWTAAMNLSLAYGSGGFGLGLGGPWYSPHPPPPRHHGIGGGGKKAQRERERERELKEREKEKEKEQGSREKESVGKGKSVDAKNGGAESNTPRPEKKDTAEKTKVVVVQAERKTVKPPTQEEQKLVEI
ncbi:hypothetical protein F4776DRAFT_673396 [Hypoxylon sp. NC0597]|nr:hypothetical protein F4776DRAFT_673396 [Hypoxylon sp. NC0597]